MNGGGIGDRAALAEELASALDDLARAWFPRCLDERYGGFLTDLDYKWRPRGPQHKSLEFEGRMTGLAAHLAIAYPEESLYRQVADHGYRYLAETMWDHAHGGWYRMVDREGRPGEHGTKHAHGSAYALGACATHHRATRDPASLELALRAFAWLDGFARDPEHGGYYGALSREGRWIRTPAENPLGGKPRDVIGTPLGCKDVNTMSDLVRGFSELAAVSPEQAVRDRLLEAVSIVRDRFVVAGGAVFMYTTLDWTPIPDFARYPQAIHSANHLRAGALALGGSEESRTHAVAKSIVDMALRYGWDTGQGGFYFGGSTFGPTYVAGREIFLRFKLWWAQAEGLRALLPLALAHPDDEHRYGHKFRQLWRYVRAHLIDSRRGGWFAEGTDVTPAARKRPKADAWRDCSHEGMALLECIQALRD